MAPTVLYLPYRLACMRRIARCTVLFKTNNLNVRANIHGELPRSRLDTCVARHSCPKAGTLEPGLAFNQKIVFDSLMILPLDGPKLHTQSDEKDFEFCDLVYFDCFVKHN